MVPVPDGVTATVDGQQVVVKGPKGELSAVLVDEVRSPSSKTAMITVNPRDETKRAQAMWGMSRTVVSNLIDRCLLRLHQDAGDQRRRLSRGGAGQCAPAAMLGLSHEVKYPIPEGIKVECPRPTEIIITGIDKQKVGQVAAEIRALQASGAL